MCKTISQTGFRKIKELLREPRKGKETDSPMVSSDAALASGTPEVNIDSVIDNDLFCQDLGAWSGKATFDDELAALIHSKSVGSVNVTLLDVLETVAACYRTTPTETSKQENSITSFYRDLYDQRSKLNDESWIAFRQELSRRISASCEQLRKDKMAELPALSLPSHFGRTRTEPSAKGSDSSENSRSPSPSSSVATASSSTPAEAQRQSSAEHLPAANEALPIHQASKPAVNHGSAIASVVPDHRYISYVWEYAQARGLAVNDENTSLETSPKRFLHKVTYDGISGEGMGRNGKLAKQAAYKQLCELKGLRLV